MPDWYQVLRAAKYLGVAPWQLLEQPVIWMDWALAAESAEIDAQNQLMQKAKKKR